MMGPIKRLIPVPFAGGLDTKTDPLQVIPGKLLDLQNGIFTRTGAINRRWGYSALGTAQINGGTPISACAAISTFGKELLLYDGTQAYSYIPADSAWAAKGTLVSVVQTNTTVMRNTSQQLSPDHARLGGIDVYAWEDSRGGIRYSVLDSASGAIIVADQPIYAGAPSTLIRPKCIASTLYGLIGIFFGDAGGNVNVVIVNPAAPAQNIGYAPIISSGFAPVQYDVCTAPDGSVYVASYSTTGQLPVTYSIDCRRISLAPVITLAQAFFGGGWVQASVAMPCIVAGASSLWVSYVSGTIGNVFVTTVPPGSLNGSVDRLVFSGLGAQPASLGAVAIGDTLYLYAEQILTHGNSTLYNVVSGFGSGSGGNPTFPTGSAPTLARGVGLASKPFVYSSAVYVNVAFDSQQQRTYFTLDAAGRVVAKANSGLGGGYITASDIMLPECQQVSPGVFQYTNLIKGIVNTESGVVQSLLGVNATTLDFIDSNGFLSAPIQGELYTVGGILQRYDGAQYTEVGFHVYPEAWVATPSASGGAMASGIYNYAVTYEWVDNTGANEISAPSIVSPVTVVGPTGSVGFVIPTLRLTRKSRVRVVIYRTTSGGTLLYRITSALLPLYNDPTVDTVTFTDSLADASITSNGAMYTQPLSVGASPVLPNAAPPACTLIAAYGGRLFLGGVDNPYTLAYSQPALAGSPMQFSSALTYTMDPDGGPITAIARMDDKLVIFKRNAIFYLTGQGPTPTGDQNDYGTPIGVPSNGIGCSTPNSVVLTAMGLMFASSNGIYLLDRGLNVTYKGMPVERYTSNTGLGLKITSASLLPNQWVIFTTNSTAGLAIVYDYFFDQWSTFTNHAAVDSDIYLGNNSLYVYAAANGTVYVQNLTSFSDAGVPIPFSLTTAWMTPGQIQGYQRIYHAFLLGQYKGAHTLNFAAGFDYDDPFTAYTPVPVAASLGLSTFGSDSPFGSGSPFGGASGASVYQFRFDLLRKCQAVRFQITDTQSGAGDEGFSLSALSLLLGVKAGGNKMPAIKQFGVG